MTVSTRALRAGALLVLLAGGCASPGRRSAPPIPPPPEVVPAPAPAAPPAAPPPAPPPAAADRRALAAPSVVRIGLATDLDELTLSCCEAQTTAEAGGDRFEPRGAVTVRPAAGGATPPVWRLQVAAVREESEAATLARRLEALSGARADARFDAASGLFRVRLGAWPTREAADAAGRRLQSAGLDAFWVVAEGAALSDPALEVATGGSVRRVAGRRFALRAPAGGALPYGDKRYRGALVAFLNARGRLNLVNELPLEQYLRGVVPAELGPHSYPELEALKAQAVAARSYTLRNLEGFAEEGFDLCGTPKCQVYGGRGAEHPLSDRAVAETAGEALTAGGAPIDALYSATCGGHTEDVEVVFPLKRASYLAGVSCIEAGTTRLGRTADTAAWPRVVTARAVEGLPERIAGARDLELAVGQLAAAAGPDTPAGRALAGWLAEGGALAPDGRLPTGERAEQLLLRLALEAGLVESRAVRFDSLRARDLAVRGEAGESGWHLGRDVGILRDEGEGPRASDLNLAAGDPLTLWLARGHVVALVQHLPDGGAAPPRPHARARWTRYRSDAELATSVRQRVPGFDFAGLDILSRGISGRVGRLLLHGRDGSAVVISGLAVRWALDLPDTLFTVRRVAHRGAAPGWRFEGRGWGHGVGLCQFGAFSMARRGLGYRELLAHYYPGTRLERVPVRGAEGEAEAPGPQRGAR